MGNFYANITLRSEDHASIVDLAKRLKRRAFVLLAKNKWTVLYDQAIETE